MRKYPTQEEAQDILDLMESLDSYHIHQNKTLCAALAILWHEVKLEFERTFGDEPNKAWRVTVSRSRQGEIKRVLH